MVAPILPCRPLACQYVLLLIYFSTWHDYCIPWILTHIPGALSIGRCTYIRLYGSVYNGPMFKLIKTYDMDGVLVDSFHRYRNLPNGSIDLEFWRANSHKLADDKLLPMAADFAADCENPEIYVILCTAREYHIREVQFIYRNLGTPNKIIMRPVGDNTPDPKLKYRALSRLFNLRQFAKLPRFFYEDNPRNIAACERLFTNCFLIPSGITNK